MTDRVGVGRVYPRGEAEVAVDMAYRVLDEHLEQSWRQERRVEREVRSSLGDELWELLHRTVRTSEDLAQLWLEFLGTVVSSFDSKGAVGPGPGSREYPRAYTGDSAGSGGRVSHGPEREVRSGLSVELNTTRPTRLVVALGARPADEALETVDLPAVAPGQPSMSGIEWTPSWRPRLLLEVGEQQPPGLYRGAVTLGQSRRACGELRVEVSGNNLTQDRVEAVPELSEVEP